MDILGSIKQVTNNEKAQVDNFEFKLPETHVRIQNVKTQSSAKCCVCKKPPVQRMYFGHSFCNKCFVKYIWSPSKKNCTGDSKDNAIDFDTDVQDSSIKIKEV